MAIQQTGKVAEKENRPSARRSTGVRKDLRGLSESAWVSLAIKALRMGWPNGIRAAIERLNPSRVKGLLTCGLFEDVFPAMDDIRACVAHVKAGEWEQLCRYDTHHGRGYTEQFCDMEGEAVAASRDMRQVDRLIEVCKSLGVYMRARGMNCLYTWDKMKPQLGGERTTDHTPFLEMPLAMLDMHTLEGKTGAAGGRRVTILSGSYAQHRELGHLVLARGWADLRGMVHGKEG